MTHSLCKANAEARLTGLCEALSIAQDEYHRDGDMRTVGVIIRLTDLIAQVEARGTA